MDDYASVRKLMVQQQIEPWAVNNNKVLDAFNNVPRHMFLPESVKYQAYHDKSILVNNIELLAPKVLAKIFNGMEIESTDRVLLVGVGFGYSYAIAYQLSNSIIGLETDLDAYELSKLYLSQQHIPLDGLFHQDGHLGFPDLAPYDKIIFTGAFDIFPSPTIFEQLSHRGLCFFFAQSDGVQNGYLVSKTGSEITQSIVFESYVPFLSNIVRDTSFHL